MKYNLLIQGQPSRSAEEKQANSVTVEGLTHKQFLVISKFFESRGFICTASAWEDGCGTMSRTALVKAKAGELGSMLDEPKIVTADGVEVCAVMSLEDLYRLMGEAPKTRPPMMMRRDGVMFREVVIG